MAAHTPLYLKNNHRVSAEIYFPCFIRHAALDLYNARDLTARAVVSAMSYILAERDSALQSPAGIINLHCSCRISLYPPGSNVGGPSRRPTLQ